jgi:hypothetical protein
MRGNGNGIYSEGKLAACRNVEEKVPGDRTLLFNSSGISE